MDAHCCYGLTGFILARWMLLFDFGLLDLTLSCLGLCGEELRFPLWQQSCHFSWLLFPGHSDSKCFLSSRIPLISDLLMVSFLVFSAGVAYSFTIMVPLISKDLNEEEECYKIIFKKKFVYIQI